MVLILAFYKAGAQGSINYASFGFGLNAGINKPLADLRKQIVNNSYSATAYYYYTPYVPIALEFQVGKLAGGGNTVAEDKDTRRFLNNYKALMLHIDVQLGEIIDYQGNTFLNVAKNFYAGLGIGGISNKVDVNRQSLLDNTYTFPGKDNSINIIVPLRVGYEFKFYNTYDEPNIRLDIGYQHYFTFGEGLDGYADPPIKFKNNAPDQYRTIMVGIKFLIGGENSYEKDIRGKYY
jgi:hypothetical protein